MKSAPESFAKTFPILRQLEQEARYVLEAELARAGIKVHAIYSRVKTEDSVLKKLERLTQQRGGNASLDDIVDLVGVRVVCLFLSDIGKVGDLIRDVLTVHAEDNKIDGAELSSFGYQSVHFVVSMKNEYAGPRYDKIKETRFEIQVRTIAMDAWAAASHYLDYKSDKGVPTKLRRDFYALSGLFYVADSHFEMFYKEAVASRIQAEQSAKSPPKFDENELNVDTFSAYVAREFPDRTKSDPGSISELLNELLSIGYKKVSDLDRLIKGGLDAFLAYEKAHPPGTSSDNKNGRLRFADVGVVRVLAEIMDDKYADLRKSKEKLSGEAIARMRGYRKYAKA